MFLYKVECYTYKIQKKKWKGVHGIPQEKDLGGHEKKNSVLNIYNI